MSDIDWDAVGETLKLGIAQLLTDVLLDAKNGHYAATPSIHPQPPVETPSPNDVGMGEVMPNPYGSASGIPATDNPYSPPVASVPVTEVPATILAPSTTEIDSPELKGKTIVASALKQQGKRYEWGGDGPDTFDCSGLAQWAYEDALGIILPRTTGEQVKLGREVKFSESIDGDLIFSNFNSSGVPGHVSINMTGPDNVIEAGDPVGIYKWGVRGKVIIKRYT
jgi:cell wall-associated NlpC family hydrolase